MSPIDGRDCASHAPVLQQTQLIFQFQILFQNQTSIVVMNALDVAFAVSRRHECQRQFLHRGGVFAEFFRQFRIQCHLVGKVFCAVDVPVLGNERLVPQVLVLVNYIRFNLLHKIRTGQMEIHSIVFWHRGQIERLDVDCELVFAEFNQVLATNEQLVLVLELADGVFAGSLQATLDIVDLHRLVQFFQLADDVTNLVDHQIGCEIAVDLVNRFQIGDSRRDSFQNAIGRGGQTVGSPISRLDDLQLFGIEGRVDLVPFLGQLHNEFIEFRKASFQFFHLHHHLGQVLAAFGRRVAYIQIIDDGLRKQF